MFVFSIVTATYQRLDLLKKLYSNLISQKNKNFKIEWVVVVEKDDFQTINFLKKINSLEVKLVINKKNFSHLIRQGIQKSAGDYVIILGDDDRLLSNSLNKIYKTIFLNNHPSWLVGKSIYYNYKKKKETRVFISFIKSILLKLDNSFLLSIVNYYMSPSVIVKRKFYLENTYFLSNYGNINDYKTWLGLRFKKKPIIISDLLSYAGYDDESISASFNLEKYKFHLKLILSLKKYKFFKFIFILNLIYILIHNISLKVFQYIFFIFFKKELKKRKNDKKTKILHMTRFFSKKHNGGIKEVIKQIAISNNYQHTVLSTDDKNYPIDNLEKNLSFIRFKKTFSIFQDIFSISKFTYILKNLKNYDIVHLHYPHFFPLFYLLLLNYNLKLIVTHHSDLIRNKLIAFIPVYFFQLLLPKKTYFHISSKKYFLNSEISEKKNIIIQNFSYNFKKYNKKKISKLIINHNFDKYIIFISRFSYYKNFDLLKILYNKNKDLNFIILTDKKISHHNKNIKIFYNVNEDEKFYLLSNSRCLLFPSNSRAESYGMTVVEGMMYSVPPVVFDINTGLNEIVKHNYNGLVAKLNCNEEYENLLRKIYFDDILHKKLSINSKKFYKKKLHSGGYSKLNKIYKSL